MREIGVAPDLVEDDLGPERPNLSWVLLLLFILQNGAKHLAGLN